MLLHYPAILLRQNAQLCDRRDDPAPGWPAAIIASSSSRVFIGHLVLAKATKAGGDQMTPIRPHPTAISMTDNPVTWGLLWSTWLLLTYIWPVLGLMIALLVELWNWYIILYIAVSRHAVLTWAL